jgi:histidinol-phosphatase
MGRFHAADLVVDTKPDLTPVSEADRAAEEALRQLISDLRPRDGVIGEELPEEKGTSDRRWIIDPIDGTKNYVRGVPVWASLIALERDGELAVGVVSAPALGRRWWASRGEGAFAGGRPIRVSDVASLEDAHLGFDSVREMAEHGRAEAFLALERRCWRARAFGDFWIHTLVAEGGLDIAVEPAVALWDVAPIQVIVEEAGGRFTDLRGNPRADGGDVLTSNGLLHDEVLAALSA